MRLPNTLLPISSQGEREREAEERGREDKMERDAESRCTYSYTCTYVMQTQRYATPNACFTTRQSTHVQYNSYHAVLGPASEFRLPSVAPPSSALGLVNYTSIISIIIGSQGIIRENFKFIITAAEAQPAQWVLCGGGYIGISHEKV